MYLLAKLSAVQLLDIHLLFYRGLTGPKQKKLQQLWLGLLSYLKNKNYQEDIIDCLV
jgi:hypothetical protein